MIMTAFKKILRIVVLQLSAIALSNVLGAHNNNSKEFATGQMDNAFLECSYKYWYLKDTLDKDKVTDDEMLLLIGRNATSYISKLEMVRDSVFKALSKSNMDVNAKVAAISKYKTGTQSYMYTQGDNLCEVTKVGVDNISYIEKIPDFNWIVVQDSVKNIAGYECNMATCSFRGRDYIAWFAPDVPVNAGPWKFRGLPGLILKVADRQGHYSWELDGIQECRKPIEFTNKKYVKTSFEKFIKTYKRYIEDPVGYITASGGAKVKVFDASTGRELTPAEIRKSKITVNVNDASVSSSRGYDPIEKIIE